MRGPIKLGTAAKRLDLSRTHCVRLLKEGKLVQSPTGDGTVMVTEESVEALRVEREKAKRRAEEQE